MGPDWNEMNQFLEFLVFSYAISVVAAFCMSFVFRWVLLCLDKLPLPDVPMSAEILGALMLAVIPVFNLIMCYTMIKQTINALLTYKGP